MWTCSKTSLRRFRIEFSTASKKAVRLIFSAASVIEKVIGEEAAAEAKDVWLYDDKLSKIERIVNGPIGRRASR
jgi:hypothetical protein